MTLTFLLLCCSIPVAQKVTPVFEAPAGKEYARIVYGGTTILPNGRFLTPKGRRLYTRENLWQAFLSPDGKALVGVDEDGFVVIRNPGSVAPERSLFKRKEIAPAGAFSKDGGRCVISLGDAGSIEVLDGRTFETIGGISANTGGLTDSYINDIAITRDGRLAYGADVANQRIVVFDMADRKVSASVKAGRQPYALCLSQDEKQLYVANIGLFDYSVVPKPRPGEGNPRGISQPPFAFPSRDSERGVDFEGRQIPGLGSPYVPDAQSIYCYDLSSRQNPRLVKTVKSGLLIHAPAAGGKAVGGSAPNALLIRGDKLYVSNANNDTVQVFDARSLKSIRRITLTPSPLVNGLRGVIPSGMAMDRAGARLYVCESGLNAVGVINPKSGRVLGHIPTGWFPVQVRLSPDDQTLYIATQKGLGRGPRGPKTPRPPSDERHGLPDLPGMIDAVPIPSDSQLRQWTAEVLKNNGIVDRSKEARNRPSSSVPLSPGRPSPQIDHVVFITKENHTFDGIFGGLRGARGEAEYAEFGMNGWIAEKGKTERLPIMPNHIRLADQFAISDNFYMEPQASGDGHRWLIGVYPSLWTTRVFYAGWAFKTSDTAKGRLTSFGSNGSQIPEDYLENGSMWEHLHRGGVTFRNYGEGWEFPGQDEGAGTSKTGSFLVVNHPLNKVLWDNTCWDFPVYNNFIPDIARVEWFKEDLEKNYRSKGKPIPRFMNITLCNDHGAAARPKDGYPYVCSYMADNDLALGRLIEYLTQIPEWKRMAIFVTQDDPGADNDHIDRHRSFVLAISPFAKRGYVSRDHTSIMSILKTIYLLFGLGPNNMFDALATSLSDMFTNRPDYTPYKHVPVDPRVFRPEATIDPNDPGFLRRKKMAPSVKMDDPAFMEWLRSRDPKPREEGQN